MKKWEFFSFVESGWVRKDGPYKIAFATTKLAL
jgi:hypothetical protein